MRRPRFSIAGLLSWIAAVAINLAATLYLQAEVDWLIWVVLPIALATQLASYRVIRCGPEGFWVGFAVTGVLVVASVLGLEFYPGTWTSRCWDAYDTAVAQAFDRLPAEANRLRLSSEVARDAISGLAFLVPQLLISSAGGLSGVVLGKAVVARANRDGSRELLGT